MFVNYVFSTPTVWAPRIVAITFTSMSYLATVLFPIGGDEGLFSFRSHELVELVKADFAVTVLVYVGDHGVYLVLCEVHLLGQTDQDVAQVLTLDEALVLLVQDAEQVLVEGRLLLLLDPVRHYRKKVVPRDEASIVLIKNIFEFS